MLQQEQQQLQYQQQQQQLMNQKIFDDVVLAMEMLDYLVYVVHFHFDLVDDMNLMVVVLVHFVIQVLI
jgi:hypothetical protein